MMRAVPGARRAWNRRTRQKGGPVTKSADGATLSMLPEVRSSKTPTL